jgi:hypothetical protein
MKNKPEEPVVSVVGFFFHTYKDKKLWYQGKIAAQISEGVYLCFLYEWITGQHNCYAIFTHEDMRNGWKLYDNRERWIEEGEKFHV